MDSDHDFVHDAVDRIFTDCEGIGLIRKKKELFIRLDGISIDLQTLSKLKNEIQASEGHLIESDTFCHYA